MTAEMAVLDAVFIAEAVDQANWQRLDKVCQQFPSGSRRDRFHAAVSEVVAQENEHCGSAHDMGSKLTLLQAQSSTVAKAGERTEQMVARVATGSRRLGRLAHRRSTERASTSPCHLPLSDRASRAAPARLGFPRSSEIFGVVKLGAPSASSISVCRRSATGFRATSKRVTRGRYLAATVPDWWVMAVGPGFSEGAGRRAAARGGPRWLVRRPASVAIGRLVTRALFRSPRKRWLSWRSWLRSSSSQVPSGSRR